MGANRWDAFVQWYQKSQDNQAIVAGIAIVLVIWIIVKVRRWSYLHEHHTNLRGLSRRERIAQIRLNIQESHGTVQSAEQAVREAQALLAQAEHERDEAHDVHFHRVVSAEKSGHGRAVPGHLVLHRSGRRR